MRNTSTRINDLEVLRAALIAERDRIASPCSDTLQVLAAPDNTAVEDQSPILHEQFVALSRHTRQRGTLAQIHRALDRFDSGEYGICEECEAEISTRRLQAVPWASRCVTCQERLEAASQSAGGSVSLTA